MKVPLGTIVRVHSINGQPGLVGSDAWGVVTEDEQPTVGRISATLFKWGGCIGRGTRLSGYGWYLDSNEYTIVSDKDVPDEVWAVLAKWRLIGEAEDVRSC